MKILQEQHFIISLLNKQSLMHTMNNLLVTKTRNFHSVFVSDTLHQFNENYAKTTDWGKTDTNLTLQISEQKQWNQTEVL